MTSRRGKRVLITGGSRGIGAEAVRRFSEHGASIAFLYHKSFEEAVNLSRETGALSIRCNVANPGSVDAAMSVAREFFGGHIDTLICNAGVSDFGLITEIGRERWKRVIDTDLNGVYYCIDNVLPNMIADKSGSIIIVSSMWGQVGASCEAAYSAAKAGLIGLTKALAKEVGPSGVRVNCIAPGMIDTQMNAGVDEKTKKKITADTPLGRTGTAEDVVKAMQFLASDESSFITGQIIGVNGGYVI
jgi:3-oxoacyl-[acyl-carrier protein] reductase